MITTSIRVKDVSNVTLTVTIKVSMELGMGSKHPLSVLGFSRNIKIPDVNKY